MVILSQQATHSQTSSGASAWANKVERPTSTSPSLVIHIAILMKDKWVITSQVTFVIYLAVVNLLCGYSCQNV